jgi:peptidyl-dipeptidase A
MAQQELTAADAISFLHKAEQQNNKDTTDANYAWLIRDNFKTTETEKLRERLLKRANDTSQRLAYEAAKFKDIKLSPDIRLRLDRVQRLLWDQNFPAPVAIDKAAKLKRVNDQLSQHHFKARYCLDTAKPDECLSLKEINTRLTANKNQDELLELWQGAQQGSKIIADLFKEQVQLSNEGSQIFGFSDRGAMERSQYDMSSAEFTAQIENVWTQVEPLYKGLQCHMRAKLSEKYGEDNVALNKPIPAHLLGSVDGGNWSNLYDLVAPNKTKQSYDLTELIVNHSKDEKDDLVVLEIAQNFWTSMGYKKFNDDFSQNSQLKKSSNSGEACPGSGLWWLEPGVIRANLCIEPSAKWFSSLHTQIGFVNYYDAQDDLPFYYRGQPNGLVDAISGAVKLSLTPEYLQDIGLLAADSSELRSDEADLAMLMKVALKQLVSIPHHLAIEQWRWQVLSGEVPAENYNKHWWQLREKYLGITSPTKADESAFDPGNLYAITHHWPQSDRLIGEIMTFQLHKKLCELSGSKDVLHRCSIYQSKKAGEQLSKAMGMGISQPWPQAMAGLIGDNNLDGHALLTYFAPLQKYLNKQNKERLCI